MGTLVFVRTFIEVRGGLGSQEKAGLRGNIKTHSSQHRYNSEADIADMYIVNMGEKEDLCTAM
ncbi:hypothetical protein CEH05_16270 [Halobacillus halophilus]|uniref:hypothetical protein n=1 Tax=Halobacillus halophilus TaxID=1570 RepID=UPI0002EFD2EF|nr:hypothetical protein [Halobacillus halophilus]ASF40625.1 hypothetical protein CEH05_16270 [Halobacillus halophilus]